MIYFYFSFSGNNILINKKMNQGLLIIILAIVLIISLIAFLAYKYYDDEQHLLILKFHQDCEENSEENKEQDYIENKISHISGHNPDGSPMFMIPDYTYDEHVPVSEGDYIKPSNVLSDYVYEQKNGEPHVSDVNHLYPIVDRNERRRLRSVPMRSDIYNDRDTSTFIPLV